MSYTFILWKRHSMKTVHALVTYLQLCQYLVTGQKAIYICEFYLYADRKISRIFAVP